MVLKKKRNTAKIIVVINIAILVLAAAAIFTIRGIASADDSTVLKNTVVEQDGVKFYLGSEGEFDNTFTGFAPDVKNETVYYVENGIVNGTLNDIIYGEADGEYAWWYIEDSEVTYTDTVAMNKNGWWKITDGRVDFDYTGIAMNKNGWWRITDGKVDFTCNSVEENENGWWKITDGMVDFGYTGIAMNKNGWWRIVDGRVDFTCNSVEENENGWWKITDGMVDFDCTGIAMNKNGWWRIVDGKVDFACNSVEENENGWWKITDGMVDFGYNGIAWNYNGPWYIVDGKVDFDYTGRYDAYDGSAWFIVEGLAYEYKEASLRENIVSIARSCVGVVPYNWGHHSLSPQEGADCSGFVYAVYLAAGIDLKTVSSTSMACLGTSVSLSQAQPGDIVVFKNGGHVGIYIGDGMFIHSVSPGYYVSEGSLDTFVHRYTDIRRVIG